jgi:hypothetical protein
MEISSGSDWVSESAPPSSYLGTKKGRARQLGPPVCRPRPVHQPEAMTGGGVRITRDSALEDSDL